VPEKGLAAIGAMSVDLVSNNEPVAIGI